MSSVKELLRGNVIDGTGTANYIPKFIDTNTIGNSAIYESSGNIGIGTSTIGATQRLLVKYVPTGDFTAVTNTAYNHLTVQGNNNGYAGITIASPNSGEQEGALAFADSASGTSGLILYDHFLNDMRFSTNGTERMRITSGGNVGIGTSSPINTLNISGTLGIVNSTANGYLIDFSAVQQSFGISRSFSSPVAFLDLIAGGSPVNLGSWRGGIRFRVGGYDQLGQDASDTMHVLSGAVTIFGSLSKSSGSFKIEHPLEEKKDTHYLVHSFVESPQANNIYRGKVQLLDGMATVNLDEVSTMTEGTFVALNRDIHTYTSNESDWDAVRGSVEGNILTIECQNSQSTATVSWLVIGERQDKHMFDTDWTDENGKVIVEPEK